MSKEWDLIKNLYGCTTILMQEEEAKETKNAFKVVEKKLNSIDLLMQELDCKDFAELRKYARCGCEKINKHYLKWEDLEFSYGTKIQKVRMNDTIYKIAYVYYDNTKEVHLLSENETLLYCIFIEKYNDNVQLFNNLHLEMVEE